MTVSAEVGGVQVDSHTGTVEDLTAQLTPQPAAGAEPAKEAVTAATAEPAKEPDTDPASEAGRTLALAKSKKELRAEFEERISRSTWEKHEATRKADKLEAELAALKAPKTDAKTDDDGPDLESYTGRIGTDFDTYEKAVQAHARDLVRHELARERQASTATQHTQARATALRTVESQGQAAHADFDAILGQFVQQGGRFAPGSAAEAQGPLGDLESVILTHPKGHSVAYEVAKDPELYQRLVAAPSRAMFMEDMGELLTRLKAAPTGSASSAAPVSKAKAPVQPAKASPKAMDGPPGDDASDEEHRLYYTAQELARRRRA